MCGDVAFIAKFRLLSPCRCVKVGEEAGRKRTRKRQGKATGHQQGTDTLLLRGLGILQQICLKDLQIYGCRNIREKINLWMITTKMHTRHTFTGKMY